MAPEALVDLKLSHRTIAAEKGLQRRAKRRKESGGRKEKRKRAKQREGSGARASEEEGERSFGAAGRGRLWLCGRALDRPGKL